jgi:hypothetical protein
MDHGDAVAQDCQLLFESQSCAFAQRPERNDAGASVVQKQTTMFHHESMIDAEIGVEAGGNGGHNALPVH